NRTAGNTDSGDKRSERVALTAGTESDDAVGSGADDPDAETDDPDAETDDPDAKTDEPQTTGPDPNDESLHTADDEPVEDTVEPGVDAGVEVQSAGGSRGDGPGGAPDKAGFTEISAPAEAAPLAVNAPAVSTDEPVAAPAPESAPADSTAAADEPAPAVLAAVVPTTTSAPVAAAAHHPPSPINVIGTVIYNVIAFALRLFDPPPVIPPGSTVTMGRSTLAIPCGCGQNVDARWYFPDEKPVGVIYLQHGLFRSDANMSALAVQLAERTNSIVVTPTVSSNFFDANGCWINGDPMHQAVATLFTDPQRAALGASATAAAIDAGRLLPGESLILPDQFVLAGHSAGGNLVSAVAGYVAEDPAALSELRGVVMLDGVDRDNAIGIGVAKLPEAVPVYQLASDCSLCNAFGSGTKALEQARPDSFVGVRLTHSSHVDAEGPSSGLLAGLACGYSKSRNVDAVQIIAAGWINDAFNQNQDDGLYGLAGQEIPVATDHGTATAVVLWKPVPAPGTGARGAGDGNRTRVASLEALYPPE
ncbi:MAG: hypothetical protein ACXWZL_07995, partial [Mycobacterium sp.]